jgi:hypothetical protein
VVRVLDGARLELACERGRLVASYDGPSVRVGQRVGVRLRGGVTFPGRDE